MARTQERSPDSRDSLPARSRGRRRASASASGDRAARSRSASSSSSAGGRRRRRRSRSRTPASPARPPRSRRYRRPAARAEAPPDAAQKQEAARAALALAAAEEEAMALRIEAEVRKRVEAALASPEVQARIEARLREERAALEQKVTRQLEEEKAALLERKRQEQAERRRKQEELDRILADNRRKVEEAQARVEEDRQRREGQQFEAAQTLQKKRAMGIRQRAVERMGTSSADSTTSRETAFLKDGEGFFNFRPSDFIERTPIGKGKDSTIYATLCPKLGMRVAVKVYDKGSLSPSKLRAVKREAAMMIMMQRKRVPLVTRFYGASQDRAHIYLVMELCPGGDLLELLLREGRAMDERRVAVEFAAPLLIALVRMHALHIIHRDVKLENIFLAEDGSVRVGDFGLTMSKMQELAISPVGTVEYMAPEVVALPPVEAVTSGAVLASEVAACDEKVDIWALGVTIYELLTGHLPFEGRDKPEIKRAITLHQMRPLPPSTSPVCADFLRCMLTHSPAARPSAADMLAHPYLALHVPLERLPWGGSQVYGAAASSAGLSPATEAAMFFEPATPPRRPLRGERTADSAMSMDSAGTALASGSDCSDTSRS
ncbi:hypothetical protein WJX81_008119 [Elliptochloris bilobata]|uniref:Protein kinase domain-containing protein n=1 Tax=Elliptochloris bilobata TaxID=381761 RepID=A0AAW1S947_9CHLO